MKRLMMIMSVLCASILFQGCFHMGIWSPISTFTMSRHKDGPLKCWKPQAGVRVVAIRWGHPVLIARRNPTNTHLRLRVEIMNNPPDERTYRWPRLEKKKRVTYLIFKSRCWRSKWHGNKRVCFEMGQYARFKFYPWWKYHQRKGDRCFGYKARCVKGEPPGWQKYKKRFNPKNHKVIPHRG